MHAILLKYLATNMLLLIVFTLANTLVSQGSSNSLGLVLNTKFAIYLIAVSTIIF